jgi:DNA-binding NarL/FixJ family response regulator
VTAVAVRVLIVDDHPVVREGLRAVLSAEPDIVVVGETGNGDEALLLATELTPDVVLMDLRLGGVDASRRRPALSQAGRLMCLS